MNVRLQTGFTLVELLIAVVIFSLLITLSIPSYTNLVNSSKRDAEVNDLLAFMVMARHESIMSGEIVTLCPLNTKKECGRDWNQELHLFKDPENNRALSNDWQVIRTLPATSTGERVVRSLSRSYFQYRPNGMILSDLGNITWCPENKDPKAAGHIIVSRGGRVRLATDQDGDQIPNRANGKNVDC